MGVSESDMDVVVGKQTCVLERVTWVSACCLARVLVPLVRWRVVRRTHLHVQLELSHDLLGNLLGNIFVVSKWNINMQSIHYQRTP